MNNHTTRYTDDDFLDRAALGLSPPTASWPESATIYVSGTQACADGSTGDICYAPQGAIANLTLHNGVRESWGFNTLQQPNSLAVTNAGGTPLMTLGWNYNPGTDNGNVAQQTIQRSSGLSSAGTVLTQNFSYVDPANRLSLANEVGGWQQTYHYDAFGNRAVDPGSYIPSPGFTPQSLSEFNTKNQWVGAASYDNAGNQQTLTGQSSPYLAIAGNFQYDGENRLIAANLNAGTVNYVYDGEGRRVEKIVGSGPTAGTTTYVYDATGNLAAEYTTAANPATGTEYLSADHLGSTRLVTNASGNPLSCTDYLPFGEEIPPGINGRTGCYTLEAYPGPADVTDHKFTGKERDAETGLDYFGARYFSGAQGRFTSPDPLGANLLRVLNPQRWNMYAYAVNNPLSYVDPDGRDAIAVNFGNMAVGMGHWAIISVNRDGSATFSEFGPRGGAKPAYPGQYTSYGLATKITAPTPEILAAVQGELAQHEGQPQGSISLAYYKTSDAETASLNAYIQAAIQAQSKDQAPFYFVGLNDCRDYCLAGLHAAGIETSHYANLNLAPNFLFQFLESTANATYPSQPKKKKEKVDTKICYAGQPGCPVEQEQQK